MTVFPSWRIGGAIGAAAAILLMGALTLSEAWARGADSDDDAATYIATMRRIAKPTAAAKLEGERKNAVKFIALARDSGGEVVIVDLALTRWEHSLRLCDKDGVKATAHFHVESPEPGLHPDDTLDVRDHCFAFVVDAGGERIWQLKRDGEGWLFRSVETEPVGDWQAWAPSR